jgi:hypothetical protein
MITAYVLFVYDGTAWCYAGTAWTLPAAEAVLRTYADRGYPGRYETHERR